MPTFTVLLLQHLKKEIEEGTIGEIRYIESQFLTSYYDKSNIRLHKENYGGAVYDLGCYNTSMLLKLFGRYAIPGKSNGTV